MTHSHSQPSCAPKPRVTDFSLAPASSNNSLGSVIAQQQHPVNTNTTSITTNTPKRRPNTLLICVKQTLMAP